MDDAVRRTRGANGRRNSRRLTALAGAVTLAAGLGLTGGAAVATVGPDAVGLLPVDDEGYTVLLDGTRQSFDAWAYAGDGGFDLLEDGTVRSRAGDGGGFGTLWFPAREYVDFSLRLEFRDDAPGAADVRGNSGVQVRFPKLSGPVEGCPTTFNGSETGNLSWIAVNCGHEIQINDSPEEGSNDPRKTGSVYGFADIGLDRAEPTPKGEWNELEVRVVGQDYTVLRNGEVVNSYENLPGVPFPGRPNDPDSSSRGLTGYVGLQAHGADQDVVSFRNVRIKELPAFPDVADNLFQREITWLANSGITTGWETADGAEYRPLQPVARDAMAAFLHRLAGSPEVTPPAVSPFSDVAPTDQFYAEISWLAEQDISTGWVDPVTGEAEFRPLAPIGRDAMAAFLHRLAGSPEPTPPAVSPFTDLDPGDQFYAEVTWLVQEGIATGWLGNDGTAFYQPVAPINRDATAAFLYRFDDAGLVPSLG